MESISSKAKRQKQEASTTPSEEKFLNEACKKKWKTIAARGMAVERTIDMVAFSKYGLTELLAER